MEKLNDLKDLLKHEVEDLYSVEEQILEALPAMIEKAGNKTLKASLAEHLKVTEAQKKRLDQVQKLMNVGGPIEESSEKKKGFLSGLFGSTSQKCKGMEGIIDEGKKIMSTDMNAEVMDAAIIACAQKIEHYEICGYGTARSYARELNLSQVASLLEQTLNEEYEADDKLTVLAESRVNKQAETAGDSSGASKSRDGKRSDEKIPRQQMEMDSVAARGSSSQSKNIRTDKGGSPKTSPTPRSGGTGRGVASSKKETGNVRAVKASANKTSSASKKNSAGKGSSSRTGRDK